MCRSQAVRHYQRMGDIITLVALVTKSFLPYTGKVGDVPVEVLREALRHLMAIKEVACDVADSL